MERERLAAALISCGQQGVVAAARALSGPVAERLWAELAQLDCAQLSELRAILNAAPTAAATRLDPLPQIRRGADAVADAAAQVRGEALLKSGSVGALLVAGGQGTRLGLAGPKGKFPVGAITQRSLFEIFAKKILSRGLQAGAAIPWCIMTSPENDHATREHFASNAWFGLNPADVEFFQQGTVPALDDAGALLRRSEDAVFRSPDGHGGSLRALHASGALQRLRARGVEQLFYFQVDNPLTDVCDPVFLGWHVLQQSEFSSKAVPKRSAGEKVGVLGSIDGAPGVIEYSDMPESLLNAREADGLLRFRAGNIAVHVLDLAFIERLTTGPLQLPWHRARKKIPAFVPGVGATEVSGTKFEQFIFDAMPLARAVMVMEVARSDEFSPVKNREGDDSPGTCLRDSMELHARWLEAAGARVPRDAEGRLAVRVEIRPESALSAADLSACKGREFPAGADILI